jgi:hypothetical protein
MQLSTHRMVSVRVATNAALHWVSWQSLLLGEPASGETVGGCDPPRATDAVSLSLDQRRADKLTLNDQREQSSEAATCSIHS